MDRKWNDNMVEWGEIYCPMTGKDEMTYHYNGCPAFDSFTQLMEDEDGELYYYRYEHDEGGWEEDTIYCIYEDEKE